MSKGSAPRPLSVKKQEFDDAWTRTFHRTYIDGKIIDRLLTHRLSDNDASAGNEGTKVV